MDLTLDLPPDIEMQIRSSHPQMEREALEIVAVEWFRKGIITHYDLGVILGLDRWGTNGVLKRHDIYPEITHEEIDAEVAGLTELLKNRP